MKDKISRVLKIVTFSLAFVVLSCTSDKEKVIRNFLSEISIEDPLISKIDISSCEYFAITTPSNMDYAGYCAISASEKMSLEDFKKDSVLLSSEFKRRFRINDSCLKFVGDRLSASDCRTEMIPVPSLVDVFTPLKEFPIDQNSIFIVKSFNQGSFLKNKFETKDIVMPAGLKHGYSEGVLSPAPIELFTG